MGKVNGSLRDEEEVQLQNNGRSTKLLEKAESENTRFSSIRTHFNRGNVSTPSVQKPSTQTEHSKPEMHGNTQKGEGRQLIPNIDNRRANNAQNTNFKPNPKEAYRDRIRITDRKSVEPKTYVTSNKPHKRVRSNDEVKGSPAKKQNRKRNQIIRSAQLSLEQNSSHLGCRRKSTNPPMSVNRQQNSRFIISIDI